jgi:hypothetical protein
MADEMDMNMDMGMYEDAERATYFIRATEVQPFSGRRKNTVVVLCKNLIEQHEIIRNSGAGAMEQIVPIEKLYIVFGEYPELLSQYPRFRKTVYIKIEEHTEACTKRNIEVPQILKDMPFILKMLEARSDYVAESAIVPSLPTPLPLPLAVDTSPLSTPSPREVASNKSSHKYNMRSNRCCA